ncbi:glycosyltransferase family 39 protein [Candidatus Poribacteria bacterium]|nr:glycosyltransferase family 39 protein [Candidatus Poribacteria bacterium]
MEKHKKILGILHIVVPLYFLICALYMLLRQRIPFMILLSMSSTITRFVPIPVKFFFPIPAGFMLLSLFGIYSGFILSRSKSGPYRFSIVISTVYLLFPPIGTILGIYTLYAISEKWRRILGFVIVQFAIVGIAFWYFHWMYPSLDKYVRQNPKTSKGIATQMGSNYVTPMYSTPDNRIMIKSDAMETYATLGMARAKLGNAAGAVREFQKAVDVLKKGITVQEKRFNTWLILPITVMILYFVILKNVINSTQPISAPIFILAVAGLKIGIDISVASINGGIATLGAPIGNYLEYYSDVPKVQGIWAFLRDFNRMDLSLHSETHPPGGALFLWAVSKIFNYDLITNSAAIILFSTLTLIPIYLLAKQFYDEKIGRYALLIFIITPNMVIFTATCMDAVFAAFLVWSIYLYFRAISSDSVIYSIIAGVSITISMIMNFTTTTLGIYFFLLAVVTYFREKTSLNDNVNRNFHRHLRTMFITAGVVIVIYILLYIGPRYSVITNLRNATARDRYMMGTGHETIERYIFICLANLFAFFTFVGFPTTALWIRESLGTIRDAYRRVRFDSFLITYILMFAAVALSTLFTLEVERVWLYMLPFIVIPAGRNIVKYIEKSQKNWLIYTTTFFLWIQTILFELFMDTRW